MGVPSTEQLLARVAELEARLEITHYWEANGTAGLHRVEAAPEMKATMPDGISCRDDTIRMQDQYIKELRAERDHWKANHDELAKRNAILRERPDLPVDRIPAVRELERLQKENAELLGRIKRLHVELEAIRDARND